MNNQRFSGITHARTLRFGVHDDIDRHLQIGTVIHINMAIADPGFNDGNFRFLFYRLNQACAATWNQYINIIDCLHQFLGSGMTGIFNQLHHIGIHSRFYQSPPDDGNQCGIGMDGIATAAQNNGIAGFKGQRKRIDRNIRAAFKNHGNHAQRHAFLNNLQTVQIGIAADNLPNRVLQISNLPNAFRNAFNAFMIQAQPVEHNVRNAVFFCSGQIAGIFRQNHLSLSKQSRRNLTQQIVFFYASQADQRFTGFLGILAQLFDIAHQTSLFLLCKPSSDRRAI